MAKAKQAKTESPGPSAPPPASEEAMALPAESRLLAWSQIVPSPLNPRKEFDAEDLKGLAESIRAEGVLENILVRRTGDPAVFELAAGERRWRAVGLLVQEGAWGGGEERIPAVVKSLTDAQLLVLAIIENVQRRDINPVEEGRAFAKLRTIDPVAWSTERIAEAIGKTQRHVQKRIQLVERLAAPVAEALSKGEINLEQAKAFALGDGKAQEQHLRAARRNGWQAQPDHIRHAMVEQLIPTGTAFFDRKLYRGEIVEDEEEGDTYFADPVEFRRLQEAAIEARLEQLGEKWPWVEQLGPNAHTWRYDEAKKGDKKAGAILWVEHDGSVHVKENVLKPRRGGEDAPREKEAAGPKKPPRPEDIRWLTRAQVEAVKSAKTLALRRAVADHPKAALCLAILGIVAGGEVAIRDDGSSYGSVSRFTHPDEPSEEKAHRKALLAPIVANAPKSYADELVGVGGNVPLQSDAQAAIFRALMEREIEELLRILAASVAQRTGCWMEYDGKPGDSALAIAIAAATEAAGRFAGAWSPGPEYFAAYRRDTLVALAGWTPHREGFAALKKSEQVKLLAQMPKGFWTPDRFAELQFLGGKAMQKAMAAPPPVPAVVKDDVAAENAKTAAEASGELRCRACGAAALRKHKKGCALGAEGKVGPAACEPAPAFDADPGAAAVAGDDLAALLEHAAEEPGAVPPAPRAADLDLPASLDRRGRRHAAGADA